MRKMLIAGNWKMHGSKAQVQTLLTGIKQGATNTMVDILVCPTFVHLSQAVSLLQGTHIAVGGQNCYFENQGAFTGEIAPVMLSDLGCKYVLIGHSERRTLFGETNTVIAKKFSAAIASGLTPILCIGETLEQREAGRTEAVVQEQLNTVIEHAGIATFRQAVIAYEPVWAIGTGKTATPEMAQEVHAFIRGLIAQNKVDLADTLRILYGGSMKADNAKALLAMPDIDGGLIGGASLDAASFLAICQAATTETV